MIINISVPYQFCLEHAAYINGQHIIGENIQQYF